MLKIAKKYTKFFHIQNGKNIFQKLFFSFMAALPHILTVLVLIWFFPEQWIGVLIVGMLLPDLSFFLYLIVYPGVAYKKDYHLENRAHKQKKVAHLLTLVVILVTFYNQEYVLFWAGAIHLILDELGF